MAAMQYARCGLWCGLNNIYTTLYDRLSYMLYVFELMTITPSVTLVARIPRVPL